MPSLKHISKVMLSALVGCLVLASCDMDAPQREVCDYTVLLCYDYNEENSATENRIESYVYTLDEYLFDEAGILYATRRITPDVCREAMDSEWDLPPGRYSVIAIGNRDERSRCFDQLSGAEPTPGVTHREDMRLSLDAATVMPGDTRGPSEPLYHGYRAFTVAPHGISRVRVDVINAHFRLRFRTTWRSGTAPGRGNYYALLDEVPSDYRLMPEHIYPRGSFDIESFDATTHDDYPSQSNDVIHHIPHTTHLENNVLHHRHDTYLNADNEVWGEFTAYRIKRATKPVLWLYRASETRAENDEMVLPRGVDLQAYFAWYDYKLDYELKQDYELDIVIDGDKISITPLQVADWDEGGELGGN